jgi:hypothetical protein
VTRRPEFTWYQLAMFWVVIVLDALMATYSYQRGDNVWGCVFAVSTLFLSVCAISVRVRRRRM